eukprot:jgi/Chrpa1/3394/Chrysochromulina_OHIO_Genome00014762-RA
MAQGLRMQSPHMTDAAHEPSGASSARTPPPGDAASLGYGLTASLWKLGGGTERTMTAGRNLRAIIDNILEKPSELRYRRLRAEGAAFATRVLACPGAIEVLKAVGFEIVQYPDGLYWTLRTVDAALLSEARLELDAGLKAVRRLLSVHDEPHRRETPTRIRDADSNGVALPVFLAVSEIENGGVALERESPVEPMAGIAAGGPRHAMAAISMSRQLQARAIIHRVKSRDEEVERRGRDSFFWWVTCAAAALLISAAVASL